MSQNHHGMQVNPGQEFLCYHDSISKEREGRFGRIFKNHPPLWVNPNVLIELGKVAGPMDEGNNAETTDNVPLGMIYLGQFIDHDITLDTTSSVNRVNNPNEIENFRTPALDLDCIFGEGPEDEPFLYESGSLRLLTGETNNNIGQGPDLEKHDLARNGQGRAMIGDPRNDENRIVSQLQLAFIRFYNEVYNDVEAANPGHSAKENYEEARQLATWHYQWVVVNEFLPTIAGEVAVDNILGKGRKWYCPSGRSFIPVEFSVASYRFGHSMITQEVTLQNGGATHDLFSSSVGRGFTRLADEDQVVHWERFFDFDGTYQRSGKMDTQMASTLLALPFLPPQTPAAMKSLATRNLLRGQSFLLPSGEFVAEKIGRSQAEIDQVKAFVKNQIQANNIDLDYGIPLWYYILAEAEVIGREDKSGFNPGEGLGPVGATLTCEVLLGLLELDSHSYLGADRNWLPTLGTNGDFKMKDLLEKSLASVMQPA
ncbi:peroxidase family protein [Spongiivirga citrea]|uniref:Peroxidase n=1 Tax=Spongiivirga citrea TaxID=1481457 RepID=A0A6M0CJV5_9FLAO|nr:heme peroxidase family protein [Spongiivirga citrea]NER16254.1 peroxidase [Spongiivirga citrea]